MAEKEPTEHIYKDETYDFMFTELVKHEKYKHLLGHMPVTEQPKSQDDTTGMDPIHPGPSVSTGTIDVKPPVTTGTIDVKPPVATGTVGVIPQVTTGTVDIKPPVTTGLTIVPHTVTIGGTTTTSAIVTGVHTSVPPVSVLISGLEHATSVGTPKLAPPLFTSTPTSGKVSDLEDFLKGISKPPLGPDVKYKTSMVPPAMPAHKLVDTKKDEKLPVHVSFSKETEKHPVTPNVEYSKFDFDTPKFPSPTKRKPQIKDPVSPKAGTSGLSDASLIDLAKVPIPKLPQFSGTDAKGDASYEVWKFEVVCLQKESIYPDAHILQAIRQSLKGEARDILLTVGDSATSQDVLTKLNGIYGIVSSNESILQQFYLAHQKDNENVAHYSIRLENMLQQTRDYVPEKTKNEMLRSKLWSGLRDPQLKNASRFKYELETDFNKLRIAIRQIEQDMPAEIVQTASLQQATPAKASDSAFEEILKRLRTMEGKIEGLDKSIEKKIDKKFRERSEPSTTSPKEESGRGRSRGSYRRFNRGRGRGRGRGDRGSLNESGSTS